MKPKHNQSGFSLVEVMMALGIVATVMIALIGLIPTGINSIHEASKVSIDARIAQEIFSDAQMADWLKKPNTTVTPLLLKDLNNTTRYYDNQGTQLDNKNKGKYIYAAKIEVSPTAPKIQDLEYTHLRKVTVYVEYCPGGRTPTFDIEKRKKDVGVYSTYVANMGRDKDKL